MARRGPWVLTGLSLAVAACAAHAATPLTTLRVARSLTRPLFVTHAPDDFHRIFIVEQNGKIKIRRNGVVLAAPFLDVDLLSSSSGERGLLGLAFHPDYAANGFCYINYTDNFGDTVIARYSVSADPDLADPDSATFVLKVDQPHPNHNGGWLAFGPDHFLYVALGDGGWSSPTNPDPLNNAQNLTGTLLGKILRLDVNGDAFPVDANRNYAIPPDNPFVDQVGDDEIWAYGLRNPWRNAFDSLTGDLYIADVGHNAYEEINFEPADSTGGRNYGWKCMEGAHCSGYGGCVCNDSAQTLPIHEYGHTGPPSRCSVTGGEVYRGCAIPDLDGTYFFADHCSNNIWSFVYDPALGPPTVTDRTAELNPGDPLAITSVSSFGLDAAGEIYICDLLGGEVFRIVPDVPISIVDSDPPNDAIDARRPIDPISNEPVGWRQARVQFSLTLSCLSPLDIMVVQQGGVGPPPEAQAVVLLPNDVARIDLSAPIEPKAWTTLTYEPAGISVRIGALPGDVDGDGLSGPADVVALIETLTPPGIQRPLESTDVDRSDLTTPADVLETIDLLNGAGIYEPYNGAALP